MEYCILDGYLIYEANRGESYSEQYQTLYLTILFENCINEIIIPIYSTEDIDIENGIQDYYKNNFQ